MRRISHLLRPLAAATTAGGAAPVYAPPASGFLTIGSTTYADPAGSYPVDRRPDGAATLVINDTDRYITIVTERDHGTEINSDINAADIGADTNADIALAPGTRVQVHRGQAVQVGWGRGMGV